MNRDAAAAEQLEQEVLAVRGVWAGFDTEIVLEDISLSVLRLDFVALIGPNGGGKTTLFKVILGLMPALAGEVRILGKPVREGRSAIGYLPQVVEFDRDFPIAVRDVVRMGRLGHRRLLRRYTARDDQVVEAALRSVDMWRLGARRMGELSGGQRRAVYMARALATEPALLLLDEPAGSLDPAAQGRLYELLRDLNERITIVLITHDLTAVSTYVKTVGCLNRHLYYEHRKELTPAMLAKVYGCPVDLLAHGVPHRVLSHHADEAGRT